MAQAPAAAAPTTCWILDPARDLALFVGVPLWVLPLALVLPASLSSQELSIWVLAFGAMGHHLPGMLRAYGDRALFARHRLRFLLAPAVLLAVCVGSALRDLDGIRVVALLWGIWHGLAQLYGFGRIYDAKAGCESRLTARLDLALCATWFGAALLFSPGRLGELLEKLFASGVPLLGVGAVRAAQAGFAAAAALVTLAFLANVLWRRVHGEPQSGPKLLALALGIGFWWVAMVGLGDVILGVALFEVFHDVQYLALTWCYNCRLAERSGRFGAFARFLFRPSPALLGLYLGLVFAYGGIALVGDALRSDVARRVLSGVVVASALLHFYYDGFIWKVREPATRAGLGLAGAREARDIGARRRASRLRHAALWLLLVAPLAGLAVRESAGLPGAIERARAVVAAGPGDAVGQLRLADALSAAGRHAEALVAYEQALRLEPRATRAWHDLGATKRALGDLRGATRAFQRAVELEPDYALAHASLGAALHAQGELAAARSHYERALELEPGLAAAHHNLALLLEARGERAAAAAHRAAAARAAGRPPP